MKGVAPAVWPVIVIVVSSAWVAPARWLKTMEAAPTIITEHGFMAPFLKGSLGEECPMTSGATYLNPAKATN